jgi:hypothetical protein
MYKKNSMQYVIALVVSWNVLLIANTPISVPSFIDGATFGINGHEIQKLLYIMKRVENLLYGYKGADTGNVRLGKYKVGEAVYSIQELARIEKGVHEKESGVPNALRTLLGKAKEDLMKVALPFVEQARGVKPITIKFIEEWARKHNRNNSDLLDWSKEEDGKELEAFMHNIQSFGQLEEFCLDLISFITDLVRSCERGWEQYLVLKKNRKR